MDLQDAPSIEDHKIAFDGLDFSESYNIHQVNGQLVATYNNFANKALKRNTEIFIKRLPRDCLLKEIFKFVHKCGRIHQIRLLMDFSGFNRGFCFVSFCDTFAAKKALFLLNGMQIRDKVPVTVKLSLDNNQLLVSRVPEYLTYHDVNEGLSFLQGLKSVTRASSKTHQNHFISFLLHFNTHKSAVESRKLLWPHVRMWNTQVYVDWAVPRILRESVKVYFYNMPVNTGRAHLFGILNRRINITRAVSFNLIDQHGHIAFESMGAATEALKRLTGLQIRNQVVQFRIAETPVKVASPSRFSPRGQLQLMDRSSNSNSSSNESYENAFLPNDNSSFLIRETPSFWNNPNMGYSGQSSPSSWQLNSFSSVYGFPRMNYTSGGSDSLYGSSPRQEEEGSRRWSDGNF